MTEDPGRVWTPEETFEVFAAQEPLFQPGTSFHYTDLNHVALGVLIEEVTGQTFAEELRARLIEPLGMASTYLAGFEDGPDPFGAYTRWPGHEPAPIDFDYTSLATWGWAAGALVSTAADLHALFAALFAGRVLSAETLAEMIGNPLDEYGLGIEVWKDVVGHGGHTQGYHTLVAHAPETGMTAFWVATNDSIDWSPAVEAVVERISDAQ